MPSVIRGSDTFDSNPNEIQESLNTQAGVVLVDNLSATFTNSTNNISATGIGVGVEVGDVIQISGSANNDTEFTVEVITDANNVIVNQAHAGGTTSKALVDEAATVTVKLLCKWYLAPIGLGQGWVDVLSSRAFVTDYLNATGRSIIVSIGILDTNPRMKTITVDGSIAAGAGGTSAANYASLSVVVPRDGVYQMSGSLGFNNCSELR